MKFRYYLIIAVIIVGWALMPYTPNYIVQGPDKILAQMGVI